MYRKFRLSTHRKNEFRKRRAERVGDVKSDTHLVATDPEVPVILNVTLDLKVIQAARAPSVDKLCSSLTLFGKLPPGTGIIPIIFILLCMWLGLKLIIQEWLLVLVPAFPLPQLDVILNCLLHQVLLVPTV